MESDSAGSTSGGTAIDEDTDDLSVRQQAQTAQPRRPVQCSIPRQPAPVEWCCPRDERSREEPPPRERSELAGEPKASSGARDGPERSERSRPRSALGGEFGSVAPAVLVVLAGVRLLGARRALRARREGPR